MSNEGDWIESSTVSDELGFGDEIVIEFEFSAIGS